MDQRHHSYSIQTLSHSVCAKKNYRPIHFFWGKAIINIMNTLSSAISASRVIYSFVDEFVSREQQKLVTSSSFLILQPITWIFTRQQASFTQKNHDFFKQIIPSILIFFYKYMTNVYQHPENSLWEIVPILQTIRPEISELLKEKQNRVATLLSNNYIIQRPDMSMIDIAEIETIYSFIARENMECAFMCDPDTSPEIAEWLAQIIARCIPDNQHVHITLHENYAMAKDAKKLPYKDLLAYFEVRLSPASQDISILERNREEFISVYQLAQKWSSNQ